MTRDSHLRQPHCDRLSVLIAAHNHEATLPAALESLLSQTLQPAEIIIVDDASTDGTLAMVDAAAARHPSLIRVARLEQRVGLLGARQHAHELAKGTLLFDHRPEDLIDPRCFERLVALLDAHPRAGLATSRAATFRGTPDNLTFATGCWVPAMGFHEPASIARELQSRSFCDRQALFRHDAITRAGGFRVELGGLNDWLWIHATAFRSGICFTPEPLCMKRLPAAFTHIDEARADAAQCRAAHLLDYLLAPENADLMPYVALGGALHQIGSSIAEAVLFTPRFWTPAIFALAQQNLHAWNEQNQRARLRDFRAFQQLSLEKQLPPHVNDAIALCRRHPSARVFIYGAGAHTTHVLAAWTHFDGPAIEAIVVTATPTSGEWEGLPVRSLDDIAPGSNSVIVLSSHSFEPEMAAACRAKCPAATRIALWNTTLSSLPL